MRHGQPERLGDDLRGGSGAEELAAATRRGAGAAAEVGRLLERDEPCAKRAPSVCTAPASSPRRGGSVTPPGMTAPASSRNDATAISIAGRPLSHVPTPITPRRCGRLRTSRRSTSAASLRYGQRVEHAGRALRPPVARVGDVRGERQPAEAVELRGGLAHEQADLPVAGVVAERDRGAVVGANAALGREDQELVASDLRCLPAHPGVLREAEHVAGRAVAQELRRERQRPFGPCRGRLDLGRGRGCPSPSVTGRSVVAAELAHGLAHDLDQPGLRVEDLAGRAQDVAAARHRRVEAAPAPLPARRPRPPRGAGAR